MKRRLLPIVLLTALAILFAASTVSAAALGSRSLSVGSRGPDVMELQQLLKLKGFEPGPIDGIFGKLTRNAVMAYQRAMGLPVVGVVGPQTTAKLLSGRVHIVQRGESLYIISRRYNTTINALRQANNLRTDMLLVGQRLLIPAQSTSSRVTLSAAERDLLARIVHAEAQGEPFDGMVAVAAVVFNRVSSAQFPNSVSAVIYQPYQFEPILNGWSHKPAGADAYRAVDTALAGQDPSRGAVFFYNPAKSPHEWLATRPVTVRIGNHVFLK